MQIFSPICGAELRLVSPKGGEAVKQIIFQPNSGRVLVVHSSSLLRVWRLHAGAATLRSTLRVLGEVKIATLAMPRQPIVLLGTSTTLIAACDMQSGSLSRSWSLNAGDGAIAAGAHVGDGILCCLELRPADLALRLLVGFTGGSLLVFNLPASTSGKAAAAPTILAEHPSESALTCATWLEPGGSASGLLGGGGLLGGDSKSLAAGYANGDVFLFSLRRPDQPTPLRAASVGADPAPTLAPSAPAADELAATTSSLRRPVRWLRVVGGGGGVGGSGSTSEAAPVLHAAGGTLLEAQPDGLMLMRGSGFRERALLAPPRGGVVQAVTVGATGSMLLPNGQPARPERAFVLTSRNELYRYDLRFTGGAPLRLPDGVWVQPNEGGMPRVRLALTPCGAGRSMVALRVSTPAPAVQSPHASTPASTTTPASAATSTTATTAASTAASTSAAASIVASTVASNQARAQAAAASAADQARALAAEALADVQEALPDATSTAPPPARSAASERLLRYYGAANAPTPAAPAAAAAVAPVPPTAFYDPSCQWPEPGASSESALLSGAASWLQHGGSSGGSGGDGDGGGGGGGGGAGAGGGAARWLGDGLNWMSREVSRHQEASRAAPAELLHELLFPHVAVDVTDSSAQRGGATAAAAGGGGSSSFGGSSSSALKGSNEARRAALLGGGSVTSSMSARERVEARMAARRVGEGGSSADANRAATARASASGASRAMHESLQAMHERGEKLGDLGDKTQQLADDAQDFAKLAKQLRQQSEKGIFGSLFG